MDQVKPKIWFVEGENRGRYPYSNSLYLNAGEGLLIDTGAGATLNSLRGRLAHVILSHYHRDHVTMNSLFQDASFYIHPADAPGVESLEGFFALSGLGQLHGPEYWEMVKQKRFASTPACQGLSHRQRFNLGELTLQVLHTPGHTPGHCAFLVEEYNLIFTGDIDLTPFGPWYGNPTSDLNQFRQSVSYLQEFRPEILLTSHRAPITENITRHLSEYAAIFDRREESIRSLLRQKPLNLEQLIEHKLIFRRHPHPENIYRYFEGNMVFKHLESMVSRGEIRKDPEKEAYEIA